MSAFLQVVILMGSGKDKPFCESIQKHCVKLGIPTEFRVTSAHKTTQNTLDVVAEVMYKKLIKFIILVETESPAPKTIIIVLVGKHFKTYEIFHQF